MMLKTTIYFNILIKAVVMLFEKVLEFIYNSILLNILILIGIILFCIWAYRKSIKSRKYYICPNCKESFRSEYMASKCCKVCGAELKEKDDTDINDSAI